MTHAIGFSRGLVVGEGPIVFHTTQTFPCGRPFPVRFRVVVLSEILAKSDGAFLPSAACRFP